MARLQVLYLDLIRVGKTELEIDAVYGMMTWPVRYSWLKDEQFFTRRQQAQAMGAEYRLIAHENRLSQVYDMALEDADLSGRNSI